MAEQTDERLPHLWLAYGAASGMVLIALLLLALSHSSAP